MEASQLGVKDVDGPLPPVPVSVPFFRHDNANRMTQITQGMSNVGFSYDNADRRTSLTLPNGVGVSYGYDNDSRITGITYQFGANTLGNLSCAYDRLGRRTQVSGSFARTSLPGAVTSAVYDAANQLNQWNGTAISYDANGNMLSDGTNSFTWNARDQVATLNAMALQYDAMGRRIKNAAGKSFLFDGANATQELSGSTVTANIWTGGLDELFQRSDSNGGVVPLTDALGSTIALVDSSGNIATTYSYDPFGTTSASGAASANPSQYTSRENEGNGLYFYRARYYSPLLGRFVSEDPMGFDGGDDNLYAYVFDDPVNLVDPHGTDAMSTAATAARAALRLVPRGAGGVTVSALSWGGFLTLAAAGVGLGAEGMVAEAEYDWAMALYNAKQTYEQERLAIGKMNQALLAHPQPNLVLAGRYTAAAGGGGGPCDPSNFDRYAQSAAAPYGRPGGISNAGRALQKHAGRGQGFPTPSGSAASINAMAQEIIEEILTNPKSACYVDASGRVNVQLPNLQGARWDSSGKFIGLIGP